MVIDLRPQGNFGKEILQALLQKEALAMQKEAQKLEKDKFNLQKETAEFDRQRQQDVALGAALGQSLGRTEEAQAPVRTGLAALAGVPSVAPGGEALQAIGQAGQAALPTAESVIAEQESPFARAEAGKVLEERRGRAFVRGQAVKQEERLGAGQREVVRHNEAMEANAERRVDLAEEVNRLTREGNEEARDDRFGAIALESSQRDITAWRALAAETSPSEAATILFGTVKPPTQNELFKRNLDILNAGNGDLAALILEPTPLQRGSALGMHTAVLGAVARLQARGDPASAAFEGLSNEEAVTKLAAEIDALDDNIILSDPSILDAKRWKQEQKAVLLEYFMAVLGEDSDFGTAVMTVPERRRWFKSLRRAIKAAAGAISTTTSTTAGRRSEAGATAATSR